MTHIGIVIPVCNEEACLPELRLRLGSVLEQLGGRYDVYFVDDASTDRTRGLIEEYSAEDERWHGIFLARNFGHQAAVTAGLEVACGDAIVVMDGDLQDEPESIPELMRMWDEGYDTVYAIRYNRKEGFVRRLSYWLFYRILHRLSGGSIPDDAGDFCVMGRRVVDCLNQLPERNRFVRGLRAWVGFRQTGVPIARGARAYGEPKYTFAKLMRLAMDGILDFSWAPLRIATGVGFLSVLTSVMYLLVVLGMRLFGHIDVAGWTTVVFLVICFGGMNLMGLGIIGEYIGRTYAEVKHRPTYIIASATPGVGGSMQGTGVAGWSTDKMFHAIADGAVPSHQQAMEERAIVPDS